MHDSQPQEKACREIEHFLVLYACDELDAEARTLVEKHTQRCPACSTSLARELRLRQAVAAVEPPVASLDDLLLARCRSELGEAIDDLGRESIRPRWLDALRPSRWMIPTFLGHPALSAALLVLIGVAVGLGLPQWYGSQTGQLPGKPAVTVSASRLSDQDLQTMGIAGINWVTDSASGSPSIELHLTAEKPLVVRGGLDDTDVKRVLTYVVQNGQRFDPGVRLDSVDLLRARSADRDVRRTLCAAARKDNNPGVRLRALEALRGSEQEDIVRQTLIDVLLDDPNPGVRVEAINSLQAALQVMSEKGALRQDERLVEVLRNRMEKDSCNYVRLQSAAAIRQLGPRELH